MNNAAYGIPGVKGTILDYQSKQAVTQTTGSVVVILTDMPDTYKESDGTTSGYKTKPFPANSPMLVSDAAKMANILTGANIVGGVSKSNDISNVLKMLDLSNNTAFCKIVKRNGARANLLSLHEKYQAIEYALENLANYPTSRVVVIGTAFDETFDDLENVEYFYVTGPDANLIRPLIIKDSFKRIGHQIKADGSYVAKDPFTVVGKVNTTDLTITAEGKTFVIPTDAGKVISETTIALSNLSFTIPVDMVAVDFTATVNPVFYNMKEIEIFNAKVTGENEIIADRIEKDIKITIAEGDENYTVNTSGSLIFEFRKDEVDATKGHVYLEDIMQNVTINGTVTDSVTLVNDKNTEDMYLEIDGLKVTFKPGIEFTGTTGPTNGIVVNYVPSNADLVYRVGEFCDETTANLTECKCTFGVTPPKNTSIKEINKQYKKLISLAKAKRGFVKSLNAENKKDLGMYIDVVIGSVKVNGIGGISNFSEAEILLINGSTIKIAKTQLFEKGDSANLYAYYRQDMFNEEVEIAGVDNNASDEYTFLTLTKAVSNKYILNSNTPMIEIINDKDNKGTYTAALYSNIVGNFGIESSYIKATVPGSCEVTYTREQLVKLGSMGYTVINKSALNTTPEIIDTPTMARDDSDFTDQSTRDLIFFLLAELRSVSKGYKGERFGEASKKVLFESSLKTIFEKQSGKTITDFELKVDYDYLQTTRQIFVDFGITEAKTGKEINITARLM